MLNDISRHKILRYVSACLVGRKTYYPKCTLCTVYTVDVTIQTALHCVKSNMFAFVYY